MSLSHLPADLVIANKFGQPLIRSYVKRGDTVTFTYENEQRTVLVLETDSSHLKGIAKERGGDYRNYLFRKITNMKYAVPFVKQNVAVTYEMAPEVKPCIVPAYGPRDIVFKNRQNQTLTLRVYHDGSANLYRNQNVTSPQQSFNSTDPFNLLVAISNFLSE